MNDELISRWNSVVTNEDIVYHLGDFSYKTDYINTQKCIDKLNGKIRFIEGNHDKEGMTKLLNKGGRILSKVERLQRWESLIINDQPIFMCHYAMRTWHHDLRGTWHIYGHSHNMLPPSGKSCDVGVDSWNFTPVSFEQLKEFMDKRPIGNHPGFPSYDPAIENN
jgi:calcineurin-like phosphoesterase family protein